MTAVGALKFGFGTLTATLWATFPITVDRFGMEISRFWATFCMTSEKSNNPLSDHAQITSAICS